MDPTNPLGYISGYPGAPTFSAGWTSNQAPNYPFAGWAGDPNAPGMTMAGRYGAAPVPWWQQQQSQAPPAQQQPVDTSAPPGNPPQSAADASQQQYDVNPLMGMIPGGGMLGLTGLLGGIPNAAGLSALGALNRPQGGNNNAMAGPAAAFRMGSAMMAPRFYDPTTGQWRTQPMFGSLGAS